MLDLVFSGVKGLKEANIDVAQTLVKTLEIQFYNSQANRSRRRERECRPNVTRQKEHLLRMSAQTRQEFKSFFYVTL